MSFAKSFWEETEKQKIRSCRAQEFPRSRAQWKGRNGDERMNKLNAVFGEREAQSTRDGGLSLAAPTGGLRTRNAVASQPWDGLAAAEMRKARLMSRTVGSRRGGWGRRNETHGRTGGSVWCGKPARFIGTRLYAIGAVALAAIAQLADACSSAEWLAICDI
jgi:hypothetical protein